MGFDYCLIAEHHFSNYGNSPAPLLQAAKIAERTTTLKIATGILVLPLWDPLRLAEEVAVLDNLSDGRFICGVGRGYHSRECEGLGAPSTATHASMPTQVGGSDLSTNFESSASTPLGA